MISIKLDTAKIKTALNNVPFLVDKAVRSTFNNTLQFGDLKSTMDGLMAANIHRPTKFTADGKGGAFYHKVLDSGPLVASFGINRKQAAYLQFLIKGMPRDPKIIERRTPDGRMLTPTKNVLLNSHGNVPRAQYERIFKRAFVKNGPYFYLPQPQGKKPAGIYERGAAVLVGPLPAGAERRGGVKLLFKVVDSVPYKKQFDFFAVAEREILKRLPAAMEEAISHRLKGVGNV